jgi:hypothetical protein
MFSERCPTKAWVQDSVQVGKDFLAALKSEGEKLFVAPEAIKPTEPGLVQISRCAKKMLTTVKCMITPPQDMLLADIVGLVSCPLPSVTSVLYPRLGDHAHWWVLQISGKYSDCLRIFFSGGPLATRRKCSSKKSSSELSAEVVVDPWTTRAAPKMLALEAAEDEKTLTETMHEYDDCLRAKGIKLDAAYVVNDRVDNRSVVASRASADGDGGESAHVPEAVCNDEAGTNLEAFEAPSYSMLGLGPALGRHVMAIAALENVKLERNLRALEGHASMFGDLTTTASRVHILACKYAVTEPLKTFATTAQTTDPNVRASLH